MPSTHFGLLRVTTLIPYNKVVPRLRTEPTLECESKLVRFVTIKRKIKNQKKEENFRADVTNGDGGQSMPDKNRGVFDPAKL